MKNPLYKGYFLTQTSAIEGAETQISSGNQKIYESNTWQLRQFSFLEYAKRGMITRHSSLPGFISDLSLKVDVIDFGSGSGWLGTLIMSQSQNKLGKYTGIELSKNVTFFRQGLTHGNLQLETYNNFLKNWIPKDTNLIFYSNSVMQYTSLEEIKSIINVTNPNYVIFDDLLMTEDDEFYTYQNYYGNDLVVHFRNINDLISEIGSDRYEVIVMEDYPLTLDARFSYEIANFEKMKLENPKTLVFSHVNNSKALAKDLKRVLPC